MKIQVTTLFGHAIFIFIVKSGLRYGLDSLMLLAVFNNVVAHSPNIGYCALHLKSFEVPIWFCVEMSAWSIAKWLLLCSNIQSSQPLHHYQIAVCIACYHVTPLRSECRNCNAMWGISYIAHALISLAIAPCWTASMIFDRLQLNCSCYSSAAIMPWDMLKYVRLVSAARFETFDVWMCEGGGFYNPIMLGVWGTMLLLMHMGMSQFGMKGCYYLRRVYAVSRGCEARRCL